MMNIEYLWEHIASKLVERGKIKSYEMTQMGIKLKLNDSSLQYVSDEKQFIRQGKSLLAL